MSRPWPGRVAVLMGGDSAEREISLQSGEAVLAALLRCGVEAEAIDPDPEVCRRLREGGYDRVFIALHGRGGEDGQIQGLLERLGLPYTGSGVLGSALAMDKHRSKLVWRALDLPTPPARLVDESSDPRELAAELGLPLMVKPVREGSSIGVARVESVDGIPPAIAAARALDPLVLAEKWIDGGEYTVPILRGRALPMIRLEPARAFYDYVAKYEDEGTRYHCPCGLEPEEERRLQALALEAYAALDGSGWGRVDLMLDHQGRPWLIEANTVPGMTGHSLVPMAAAAAGIGFDRLVLDILESSRRGGE
ncbi:MAG: D-alanine--D-alanine ligase [Gammaproteobacteria bacterium]|nr:MAG: D-alanine--D-alanine ligase [Gammaproteobacteria bacterium]